MSISYGYDNAGRRTSMAVSGQSAINYTFDNANHLKQITQGSATVTIVPDADGRRQSVTLPNGVAMNYGYDAASQLTGITYMLGSNTLGTLTYAYDSAGRRTGVGGSYARTNTPAAVSPGTPPNANNQLPQWNGKTLSYDLNGNLTSDGTNTYTWNARNQLVTISGGVTASFQYDPFGRRVSKTIGGTTQYLYDGANPVQEISGGSASANLLTGGVDEYFQRTDSAGARNFLTDALGSTLALTDSTGTVQNSYTFEPFGNSQVTGTTTNSFAFTGRELDPTGLYLYRARYYHPQLQRFISEDPIGFRGGINRYAYVLNSPPNFFDPLGLEKKDRLKCAATVADEVSIAGYFDLGDNPITKGLLGNTFSGLVDLGEHFAGSDPAKLAQDVVLGGLGQGVIPGGGAMTKGALGVVQDAAINAFERSVTGAGSEVLTLELSSSAPVLGTAVRSLAQNAGYTTLDLSGTAAEGEAAAAEGSLAGLVFAAKLTWDAYAFGYGLVRCW
ncbi:MAG TPA: RHS repeat-associated core domain-containing protein [Candidatus Angelobacter sp.]|nr:RHS repeat-associated core domain-containing protein [Candidatus Angelobacter sp.]